MTCYIKQECNQQEYIHAHIKQEPEYEQPYIKQEPEYEQLDIRQEPEYDQLYIKQEPEYEQLDIKQEARQPESCQVAIKEEQVETHEILEPHFFRHAKVKHEQFDQLDIKQENTQPNERHINRQVRSTPTFPKRDRIRRRKAAKPNNNTTIWRSPERIRKQFLRKELRDRIRSIKLEPVQTTADIAEASTLLQARFKQPEDTVTIKALEEREYVIRERKLIRYFAKLYCTKKISKTEHQYLLASSFPIKSEFDNDNIKMENRDVKTTCQMANNTKIPQQVGANAPKLDTSNIGHRMLTKMGWKEGQALGHNEGGITEPVKVMFKNERRGLGQ